MQNVMNCKMRTSFFFWIFSASWKEAGAGGTCERNWRVKREGK